MHYNVRIFLFCIYLHIQISVERAFCKGIDGLPVKAFVVLRLVYSCSGRPFFARKVISAEHNISAPPARWRKRKFTAANTPWHYTVGRAPFSREDEKSSDIKDYGLQTNNSGLFLQPANTARNNKLHHIGCAFIDRFYFIGRDDDHLPCK